MKYERRMDSMKCDLIIDMHEFQVLGISGIVFQRNQNSWLEITADSNPLANILLKNQIVFNFLFPFILSRIFGRIVILCWIHNTLIVAWKIKRRNSHGCDGFWLNVDEPQKRGRLFNFIVTKVFVCFIE